MEADDLPCSRNAGSSLDSARDPEPVEGRTPLVGRAQGEINQPPSLKRERASLEEISVASFDGRSGTGTGAIP